MLANGGAACLAAANDLAVAVGQLLEKLNVLVINISRTWAFAINEKRVLANSLCLDLWFTPCVSSSLKCQGSVSKLRDD